eukprot:TRINITY_DN12664_c0_g1_i1.p1 TRINITY_DN12664_c0_g1~~TRINITY_DN12664_c0_g1_i1.p1  ORF type:complete len:322 (-),score=47.98 TRINITY_DN12664_c0_g1_i1:87-1052(-)
MDNLTTVDNVLERKFLNFERVDRQQANEIDFLLSDVNKMMRIVLNLRQKGKTPQSPSKNLSPTKNSSRGYSPSRSPRPKSSSETRLTAVPVKQAKPEKEKSNAHNQSADYIIKYSQSRNPRGTSPRRGGEDEPLSPSRNEKSFKVKSPSKSPFQAELRKRNVTEAKRKKLVQETAKTPPPRNIKTIDDLKVEMKGGKNKVARPLTPLKKENEDQSGTKDSKSSLKEEGKGNDKENAKPTLHRTPSFGVLNETEFTVAAPAQTTSVNNSTASNSSNSKDKENIQRRDISEDRNDKSRNKKSGKWSYYYLFDNTTTPPSLAPH